MRTISDAKRHGRNRTDIVLRPVLRHLNLRMTKRCDVQIDKMRILTL